MNLIKLILAALGLVFSVLVVLWIVGFVWSILWYLIVFGIAIWLCVMGMPDGLAGLGRRLLSRRGGMRQ